MKFMRVGGLSPVNHKKRFKLRKDDDIESKSFTGTYHLPPTKHGIYAFPFPYFEGFLVMWSERHRQEIKTRGITKFEFNGQIWSHLKPKNDSDIIKVVDSWYLTTIEVYEKTLQKEIHKLNGEMNGSKHNFGVMCDNAFKRGRGGMYVRDHLEVYIDKQNCSKIG